MRIVTKLRGLMLGAVVVSIAVLSLYATADRRIARVQNFQDEAQQVLRQSVELSLLTADVAGLRTPRAQRQWREVHANLDARLQALSVDAPGDTDLLTRAGALHAEALNLFQDLAQHRPAAARAPQPEIEIRLAGQLGTRIHSTVAEIARLQERLVQRELALRRTKNATAMGAVLLLVCVVCAGAVWVQRAVVLPLHDVRQGATRLGAGELAYRIPVTRADEIGELAADFNRMTANLGRVTASRNDLEREVAQRRQAEARLTATLDELQRSNRELEQFAYVASHDLQEPLRKITVFGERLANELGSAMGEPHRDYLRRMLAAADRMQTLIRDLLDYARLSTRAQPFRPVDLNAIVRDVLSDLEARLAATAGQIDVSSLPTVEAEPVQMRQLLLNLIGNALKFVKPGETPRVHVSARLATDSQPPDGVPPGWCELRVEDEGIGFDEQYTERIFGIFQRLHGREAYEGTGIGLAVCRKIVERHGGTIVAHGHPGVGAQFIIRLPLRHA